MGHESIETTRIYLRRTSTEQQAIVDKIITWWETASRLDKRLVYLRISVLHFKNIGIALFATNSHVTHTVKGFKIGSSMQSNAFFGQSSFAL